MPRTEVGQQISFLTEIDSAHTYASFVWYTVKKGDTIRKVASKHGGDLKTAQQISQLNGIRDINKKLDKPHERIKLPGTLAKGDVLSVLADDPPPLLTGGYAKFDMVSRPGRKGITRFLGSDPISYDVPIQFEAWHNQETRVDVEQAIQTLEKMAGLGPNPGVTSGPPAVIRVSVTDNNGSQVMLVPFNYQWSTGNPHAPLWRISNIAWDANPHRASDGRRLRQKAVVTIWEYTPITVVQKSATARSRAAYVPSIPRVNQSGPRPVGIG